MEKKKSSEQNRTKTVNSFTLSDEVKAMIDELSKEKFISRSAVISIAVTEYYKNEKK